MNSTPIMSLFATLGLDAGDFNSALDEAQKNVENFGDSLKSNTSDSFSELSKNFESFGKSLQNASQKTKGISLLGGAVGGSLASLAYKAGLAADDLNTLSKVTGIGTDELQKMQYASDLVDVSVETVTGSLKKLTMNMNSAKDGTGTAGAAFDRLGVRITTSNGTLRDSQEVFYDILEALGEMKEGTDRDALAMELFGRSATDLNPIIGDGAKQMKALGQEAEDMGLILSQDALDGANKLNDAIDTLKARIRATGSVVGAEIAETVAPAVEKIGDWISDILAWVRSLGSDKLLRILKISAIVAAISPLLSILGKISTAMSVLTTHPLIAAASGIILLIGGIATAVRAIPKPMTEAEQRYSALAKQIGDANKKIADSNAELQNSIDTQTKFNQSIDGQYDGYESLLNRLGQITDEQGHVLENYQDEVWFIRDELSEALGIELEIIDNQIQNYQDVQAEIYKTIQAKKAEILLRANEDAYADALGRQLELSQQLSEAEANYTQVTSGLNAAKERQNEITARMAELEADGEASTIQHADELMSLRDEYEALEFDIATYGAQLQSVVGGLAQANEAYNKNASIINNYDRVQQAATLGTENLENAITVMTNNMRTSADADAETLRKQLDEYKATYASMEDAVSDHGAKISKSQFDEMERMIAITEQELLKAEGYVINSGVDMVNAAYKNGADTATGLANGIDDYSWKVANAVDRLAQRASSGFASTMEIASPSKLMMKYGKFIDQGLAEGIDNNLRLVDDAVDNMTGIIADKQGSLGANWEYENGSIGSAVVPQSNITMNVYGAQGQDVEELADIVSRKINDAVMRDRRVFA